MQSATLEPEVAFLNASLVSTLSSLILKAHSLVVLCAFQLISSLGIFQQIPDVFPVLAAAHKTLVAKSRDSLTTRTLHSELVYNFSGSKHVRSSKDSEI